MQSGSYAETVETISCNNDWALQRIVIFTSLCKCLDKFGYMGKHFQLTVLMPSCIQGVLETTI